MWRTLSDYDSPSIYVKKEFFTSHIPNHWCSPASVCVVAASVSVGRQMRHTLKSMARVHIVKYFHKSIIGRLVQKPAYPVWRIFFAFEIPFMPCLELRQMEDILRSRELKEERDNAHTRWGVLWRERTNEIRNWSREEHPKLDTLNCKRSAVLRAERIDSTSPPSLNLNQQSR